MRVTKRGSKIAASKKSSKHKQDCPLTPQRSPVHQELAERARNTPPRPLRVSPLSSIRFLCIFSLAVSSLTHRKSWPNSTRSCRARFTRHFHQEVQALCPLSPQLLELITVQQLLKGIFLTACHSSPRVRAARWRQHSVEMGLAPCGSEYRGQRHLRRSSFSEDRHGHAHYFSCQYSSCGYC